MFLITISPLNQTFSCENKGNDRQPKKLLIGKQILPVSNLEIYSEQKGEYEYWFLGFLGLHTGPQLPLLCKFWERHCNEVNFNISSTKPSASIQKNCNLNIQMFLMIRTKFHITLPPNDIHYHFTSKNFDVEIKLKWFHWEIATNSIIRAAHGESKQVHLAQTLYTYLGEFLIDTALDVVLE